MFSSFTWNLKEINNPIHVPRPLPLQLLQSDFHSWTSAFGSLTVVQPPCKIPLVPDITPSYEAGAIPKSQSELNERTDRFRSLQKAVYEGRAQSGSAHSSGLCEEF